MTDYPDTTLTERLHAEYPGVKIHRLWEQQGPKGTTVAWMAGYLVNGRMVIVQTFKDGNGWEAFTANDKVDIDATVNDVAERCGLVKPTDAAGPAEYAIGTKVVDRDGFVGVVDNITYHDDNHWYDVRFERGVAVRYPSDLKPATVDTSELGEVARQVDTEEQAAAEADRIAAAKAAPDWARLDAAEQQIIERLIDDFLGAGYAITVEDGEELVLSRSTDKVSILKEVGGTDETQFYLYPSKRDVMCEGLIRLIHGNGRDVISDVVGGTPDTDALLEGAEELARQLAEAS